MGSGWVVLPGAWGWTPSVLPTPMGWGAKAAGYGTELGCASSTPQPRCSEHQLKVLLNAEHPRYRDGNFSGNVPWSSPQHSFQPHLRH